MKIYKVSMEMPWRHDDPEKAREETAEVRAFFSTLPSCARQEPDAMSWLVEESDIGAVMVRFASSKYNEVAVKSVELIMDTIDPARAVSAMLERVELAATRLTESYEKTPGFNEKVGSPLSGPHLHSLNRLLLLENCCTDQLQAALDKGWRIIAVCPQEARRPDYVLGQRGDGIGYGNAARDFD